MKASCFGNKKGADKAPYILLIYRKGKESQAKRGKFVLPVRRFIRIRFLFFCPATPFLFLLFLFSDAALFLFLLFFRLLLLFRLLLFFLRIRRQQQFLTKGGFAA